MMFLDFLDPLDLLLPLYPRIHTKTPFMEYHAVPELTSLSYYKLYITNERLSNERPW